MSQNSNLFLSIGKPVKDEYGRAIGKVASFALTPSGKFDAAFIEFNDGKFSKQPMEHLEFNGTEVTFISKPKSQASVLCDQIPLIWRKDQALKDLAEKKKIAPDIYQELHANFEGVLNQLKKDAQSLSDEIDKEIVRCEEEIKTLSYAVVNLELEHEIGKVNDEAYKSAFTLLQDNLKRANAEKSDMELTKSKLSNILLGDSLEPTEQKAKTKTSVESKTSAESSNETPNEESNEAPPELPEPPVVVYVKEVGKAGI
jgi:chromosome segregation ATPase